VKPGKKHIFDRNICPNEKGKERQLILKKAVFLYKNDYE